MSSLNPSAAVFIPRSQPRAIPSATGGYPELPADPFELSEVALSPAELEELEAVESWVELLASLEEEEVEHSIALALRYGDKGKIAEIRHKAGGPHHKGGRPGKKGGVHKPSKLQQSARGQ
ncbi:hypothetical protein N2152v2_002501 [Parachlorella kessleri]